MDGELQALMQELGMAINDALSDSDRIAEAVSTIKKAGYDVFMVLEATIGFNRREDAPEPERESPPATTGSGKPRWTAQDLKLMRALKISLGDDGPEQPPNT